MIPVPRPSPSDVVKLTTLPQRSEIEKWLVCSPSVVDTNEWDSAVALNAPGLPAATSGMRESAWISALRGSR